MIEKNGVERMGVLDHGYVRMEDAMGNDLTTVNAAKVSFDKRSEEFKERDQKLVNFLGENEHTSPFRHSVMTFEVYAPMFVKNQWYKYIVGHMHDEFGNCQPEYRDPMFAWNESSRRYVTEEPIFYIPQWRSAPDNKKQGSGDFIDEHRANVWSSWFRGMARQGEQYYNMALEQGIAPEQARVFLPAYAMYVRWWWTCSLQGALHLIEQRTAPDAQWEFRRYAHVVYQMVRQKFPVATDAFLGGMLSDGAD